MNKILIACIFSIFFNITEDLHAATHTYDPLNRLTSVVYSASQRIDYVYDAAGNLIEERVNGSQGLTVSAQASPAAGGSVSISPVQSGYVASDTVTATATPSAGYTFTGWSGYSACTTNSACTFTVPTSSVSLVANFAAPSGLFPLRVNALPAVGGTVTPSVNAAGYAPGASITLTATPAPGYVIDYWYGAACPNFSGSSCTFTMPAHSSDVFVRFKQAGSGYLITYASNNASAGVLDISPSQDRIPAGTQVTLKVRPASGYLFSYISLFIGGVENVVLCNAIQAYSWPPGSSPSCTFTMPASDMYIETMYAVDPNRYTLDITASPLTGGTVDINVTPNDIWATYIDFSVTPCRRLVAGGLSTTLTAKPAGARSFVKWANEPCANSTNPVCTFTMPTVATVSNPIFSDEPAASCTYSVAAPSLAFTGAGGSKTITVNTQAGCNFTPTVIIANDTQGFAISTVGNVITLTVSPNTFSQYGKFGFLRIHTGTEVFDFAIAQAASPGTTITVLPAINFPTVSAGDIPITSSAVTIVNSTGISQKIHNALTTGSFAVSASTCGNTLDIGASYVVNLQFVPNKDGALTGEMMLAGTSTVWRTALSGTALPTRFNVAAARKGSTVTATDRVQVVDYSELAVTNGERRGKQLPNQAYWYVQTPNVTAVQPIEIKFSSPQSVEWLYLFGRPNDVNYSDPSPTTIADGNVAGNDGFSVEYWTGTAWVAVSELLRVDSPNLWQRVKFTPVTTDRIRLKLTPPITNQVIVSEIEVWTVASDIVPAAFSFANVNGIALSTDVSSAAITPTGYNYASPISVVGGSYSINCNGVFTTVAGTIEPGQSVCVRHTSSAVSGGSVTTTLTIGGVSASFVSTAQVVVVVVSDITPDGIASQSVSNLAPSATVNFAAFSVTGINAPAPVSISNGLYSVGCTGSYTSLAGSVSNGQSICVRHVTSNFYGASVTSVIQIGSANISFTSSTTQLGISVSGKYPRWDFTGNGRSDLLMRNTITGYLQVWMKNNSDYLMLTNTNDANSTNLALAIQTQGEFNGDTKKDIVWRNTLTGETLISYMDAGNISSWGSLGTRTLDNVIQGSGDFNGDGRDELVWRNTTTGAVELMSMKTGTPVITPVGTVALTEQIKGTGDFNGDGKADLVWRNTTTGAVSISTLMPSDGYTRSRSLDAYLGNTAVNNYESTIQATTSIGPIAANLVYEGVGDFDGDGKSDLLWRNSVTGEIWIAFMNGATATWASVGILNPLNIIQAIGDYDGDGRDDILWTNGDFITIYYMNGISYTSQTLTNTKFQKIIYGK